VIRGNVRYEKNILLNPVMKLSVKQKELVDSLPYRVIMEKAKVTQSTVKRLKTNISDMRIVTLENILKRVWSMTIQDFINLE
jgi:hypothetical protein